MRFSLSVALVLIAFSTVFMPASAQNSLKNGSEGSRCVATQDLVNTDLFGAWSVLLEGGGKSVVTRMQLQRNPEFAESLAGRFEVEGKSFEVFGDIDAGAFDLEEANNGKDISAIWKGRVAEGSCGQTILGTRRSVAQNSDQSSEQSFVLRRPGW
jgi:hypothetical protein